MHSSHRLHRSLLSVAVFTLIVGLPAWAQAYIELPVDKKFQSPAAIRNYKARKNSVLKGVDALSQYGGDMLTYYKQYLLPALTRNDQRQNWDSLRREVISDLANASDPKARLEVLRVVWAACNKVVGDDQFNPASRYNFLLMMGELNQKEANGNSPPVPLSKYVLPKLLAVLQKEGDPPLLRYAAVLGLLRHAELTGNPKSATPMQAADKEKIAQLMIQLAADVNIPTGVDKQAHDWLRAKAVVVLGELYLGSEEVVGTLANLLTDESTSLDVRCEAATAIGRISEQIDSSRLEDLVGRLTKLAYDCVQTEFDILRKKRSQSGGRMDSVPPPRRWQDPANDASSGRSQPEIADERTTPTRRRLLFQLLAVQEGLMGNGLDIPGLVKLDGAADKIQPLQNELAKLIDALQDIASEYEKLGAIIQVAAREELPPMVPESLKRRAAEKDAEDPEQEGLDVADAGAAR